MKSQPTSSLLLQKVPCNQTNSDLFTCEDMEDITRWQENMNFMFEWQEQYLTSESNEWETHCSCHENIKISLSWCVMFFLLSRRTDDGIFYDFPKISNHFPNTSENSPELVWRSRVWAYCLHQNSNFCLQHCCFELSLIFTLQYSTFTNQHCPFTIIVNICF